MKADFFWVVLSFIFYWFGMVRRQLTDNHSIIVRLMQRFRQAGNVADRPRAGRPRKTTPRGPAHIQTGAATAVQYSWCTSW
jgi:hypothetical protein